MICDGINLQDLYWVREEVESSGPLKEPISKVINSLPRSMDICGLQWFRIIPCFFTCITLVGFIFFRLDL